MVSNDDINERLKAKREGTELPKEESKSSNSNNTTPEKSGIMGTWNQQSNGIKALSIIAFCCIGILIIGAIGAMMMPSHNSTSTDQQNTSTPATTTQQNTSTPPITAQPTATTPQPTTVTIAQLYGSSIAEGTTVKVTGKVVQSDGYNLRLENSNYQDILVTGSGLSAYEDQKVTIVGTYSGPTSYTTVMGGERTVPSITDAQIVK